jgi:hypothetical protein
MTLMAIHAAMYASGPRLVRLVMHVTHQAGAWIVLEIVIYFIGRKTHADECQENSKRNYDFGPPGNAFIEPLEHPAEQTERIKHQKPPTRNIYETRATSTAPESLSSTS